MRLKELHVERMPGFTRRGFSLQALSMGINVIWGPNGSGKTTACLAIRHLLWPNHCADTTRIMLSSIWTSDGQDREISLEGSSYHADPALPMAEIQKIQPHLYTIGIDDLFHATDEEFASAIMREIRGGYDLAPLQASLIIAPKLGENENRLRIKKEEELAGEIRRQQSIYEKELSLQALEEKIRASQSARQNLARVKVALAIKERQAEYDEIVDKITAFPAGIEHVRSEDRKKLEEWQGMRRDLQKELSFVPEYLRPEGDPELGQAYVNEIRVLDTKIEAFEQARKEAEQHRIFYCRDLAIPPEMLEKIDLSEIENILPSITRLYECRLKQKEYETKLALMKGGRQTSLFDIRRFFTISSAFSLFGLAIATVNAFVFMPLPVAIGVAVITCIVVLSIALKTESQKEKKEEFQYLLDDCRKEVEEIQRGIGLYLKKTQIEKFPDFSLLGNFLQQLKLAQEHLLIEKKKEVGLVPLRVQREELAGKIETLLGDKFSHVVEMENALAASRKRIREKDKRERIIRDLAQIEEQVKELLARCGCKKEDELFLRHAQLASYAQAVEKRSKLEGNLAELKRQLGIAPDLACEDKAMLEQRRQKLEEQEASYIDLIQEKTGIEKDIENAKASRDLEEKREALQQAEENLESKRAEFQSKIFGLFLLEETEESFKKEMRPEALKNGDAYFQRFTKNAYAIHGMGDEEGKACFLAYDCQNSSVKKHHELSCGTRLQLLLAIRLGFIAALEKQSKMLPLILDEAASHADDERWDAIAHVLSEEAKAGRQILYFTCQRFVREAWKDAAFHDLLKTHDHAPFVIHAPKSLYPEPTLNEALTAYCQRIGLPGLDFTLPIGSQSIGHFLENSAELYGLLQAGISTFGQVEKMSESKALSPFLTPTAAACVIAKGALLENFLNVYRIGRPPAVERIDLEEALKKNIISDTFFPSLCELATELKGSGMQILEALNEKKIKGFRASKIEELRAALVERGKLDSRVPLAPEELRTAFWQVYPPHARALPTEKASEFLDALLQLT